MTTKAELKELVAILEKLTSRTYFLNWAYGGVALDYSESGSRLTSRTTKTEQAQLIRMLIKGAELMKESQK